MSQVQRLRFDHLTIRDGLSHDIVTSIAQDAHGFLWFGTEDGLNRYDGYSFRTYNSDPSDSTSLGSPSIDVLFVDRTGRMWVGANGINLYDERTDGFHRFRHAPADPFSLPDNHVPAMCQDTSGAIWAGTDKGLARLDEGTGEWKVFQHDPGNRVSLSANVVRALLVDRAGSLWVGTTQGLDQYDGSTGTFRHIDLRAKPGEAITVNSIFEDADGSLWVGTLDRGLVRVDPISGRVRSYRPNPKDSHSIAASPVFKIASDAKGRIWIGHFAGLDLFDPATETFEHYSRDSNDPDPLLGERVYAIYPDRSGAVWLGTYHGGVERYDPVRQSFALVRPLRGPLPGLPDENVFSVLEDRRGRLWAGTQAGLAISAPLTDRPGTLRFSELRSPLSERTSVLALFEDSRGTVWIGRSSPGKLQRVDLNGRLISQFPFTNVRTALEDRSGNLWFGIQSDGLIRYTPSTDRTTWFRSRPDDPDSLHGDGVWSLYEDRNGILWAGTVGANECLNRFDPSSSRFTHVAYQHDDPTVFPGGSIRAIAEDNSGSLWLGHWGGGLTQFDPATHRIKRFTKEEGLPSNYVKAILNDEQGNLWISTERGMIRFTPANGDIRVYSTEDGLQGDRFYSGSAFRGRSGRMYFGGEHGLNIFRPDEIRDRPLPFPVRFTSFKVFERPFDLPDGIAHLSEIQLSYRDDFISFEFVALDYSSPRRTRYSYRLEGLNPDWIDAGDRRYAAFTHLNPGTYTFRVKAANADGIWNEEGASMNLVIDPPFWATAWFRLLALLSVMAGLYLLYHIRVARLLAVEWLRQRIAQDLHDDIGTNLSTIALASNSLLRERGLRKDMRGSLDRIRTVAARATDQMRDIVWVLKTGNDSLDDLVVKMREVASQLLLGTSTRFEAPPDPLLGKVNLEFKRNVFLFYKECVNNIARHAKARNVNIRVSHANGVFLLLVEDDGRGFKGNENPLGSGLQNLRDRAKYLGGTLELSSATGKGTKVVLKVKTTQMRHGFRGRGSVG